MTNSIHTGTRKLTPEQVEEIRSGNAPARELADRFGTTVATIYNCRNGHFYRNGAPAPKRRARRGRPQIIFAEPCECGCGELAAPGKRFIFGHHLNVPEIKARATVGIGRNKPRSAEEFLALVMSDVVEQDRGYRSACLIYQGRVNPEGYPVVTWRGHTTTVSRAVWHASHGLKTWLPRQVRIMHLCVGEGDDRGHKRCVNPDHLWVGTMVSWNA